MCEAAAAAAAAAAAFPEMNTELSAPSSGLRAHVRCTSSTGILGTRKGLKKTHLTSILCTRSLLFTCTPSTRTVRTTSKHMMSIHPPSPSPKRVNKAKFKIVQRYP